jgi:hypothetical protein
MTGIGFEYLRESALADRVGVFVPQESMLAKGALCFVTTSGGKIKVYINQRIAQVIGATIPSDPSADRYVVR